MGDYNPDRPYVLGMQWPPLVADTVLLDTCTEVGYTFRAATNYEVTDGLRQAWVLCTQPPPGQPTGKHLAVNVYRHGRAAGTGPVRTLTIPCTAGSAQTGAALAGGAASVPDAMLNPSDARHVTLTGPGAACRFWFGTAAANVRAALLSRRILDVSVLYAVSGPFDKTPGAMALGLERGGVNWVMDDALAGPSTPAGAVVVRRARLGELNPWCHPTGTPATSAMRLPWRWDGRPDAPVPTAGLTALASTASTGVAVRVGATSAVPAGTVFQIHHVALEIAYGEENRAGAGGLDISGGASLVDGLYVYQVPVVDMWNFGYDVSQRRGERYAVTVGMAHAGAASVASPVPIRVDRLSAVAAFPTHTGLVVHKTCGAGDSPTAREVPAMPAIVLCKPGNPPVVDSSGHAYLAQAVGTACSWNSPDDLAQTLTGDAAGTYVWARFYARHLPGANEPLTLIQLAAADSQVRPGPRAQISVAEFDRLPELAGGWREVTLRLDPPAVLTGAGVPTRWGWYSPVDRATPWQILGADQNPASTLAGVAGDAGHAGLATIDEQDDGSADLTLMLAREMDLVTGLAVTTVVQPLAAADPACPGRAGRVPTGVHYHRLSWDAINSAVVGGWGCYELQRQDDTMAATEWETIAQVTEPAMTGMDDLEARIGVPSRYRIRMVHRTGITGPWSASVTGTIPPPGVTGVDRPGLLVFTSNHNPAASLAYLTGGERRDDGEEFTFPEAGHTELQEMYGRDYRTAARPAERAGVEFTRTLLVNAAAVPAATMDNGFTGPRDLAWDSLPYVCVRDELGNRWLAALLVPTGTVRRRGHLHLAQVTIVQVTDSPAPTDGGPIPCQGLAPAAGAASVTAQTPTPPAVARKRVADTFSRTVISGWGSTETPGLPWRVIQGPPADVSTHDGVGTMLLRQDSSVIQVVTEPDDLVDVDVRARFRIDRIATGQPINAYLIGRDHDGSAYRARMVWQPDGTISIGLERLNSGTPTSIAPLTPVKNRDGSALTYSPGQWTWLRLQVRGPVVQAGAWRDGQPVAGWPVQAVDTTHPAAGRCGVRAALPAGNTNPMVAVDVDDFQVHQPMAEVDIRVLLRTGEDDWSVELAHYSYIEANTFGWGWDVYWSRATTCVEVASGNVFYQCVPTDDLKLVPRQRIWLRAVYQQTGGGAGQARMTLSTSLDGTAWTPVATGTGDPNPLALDPGFLSVELSGTVTVSRLEIRDGIDGPVIASPDFQAHPAGTSAFTDAQGNPWEVDGGGICAST